MFQHANHNFALIYLLFLLLQIHNDDGVWVRLSGESIKEWCGVNGFTEAWCLQYNQHLGKTLLIPIEEPKSILDEIIKETLLRKIPEFVQESRIRKGDCY